MKTWPKRLRVVGVETRTGETYVPHTYHLRVPYLPRQTRTCFDGYVVLGAPSVALGGTAWHWGARVCGLRVVFFFPHVLNRAPPEPSVTRRIRACGT